MSGETATQTVFFYGSFMDAAVLAERGIAARNGRRARVKGWQLVFEPAPSLVRSLCGVVWGMAFDATSEELRRLYAAPLHGAAYRPVELTVSIAGREIPAVAYVADPASGGAADDAVERVKDAARAAGLPAAYVDSIGKAGTP